MPDPILKEAADEIKAVLSKHDIAGIVFLGSQTHSEFVYALCPTWSCAKVEGGAIRIRALRSEYPSQEAQRKCVEATTGIFCGFQNLCARGLLNMQAIIPALGKHFDISHIERRE